MRNRFFCATRLFFFITISGLLASCSGIAEKERDDILKKARKTYAQAKTYPHTAQLKELSTAKQSLIQAEKAEDVEELKRLAKLAIQKTQNAIEIAERKVAKQNAEKEREMQRLAEVRKKFNPKLQKKLAQWNKKNVGRLVVTLLNHVSFDIDKSELQPEAIRDIKIVAKFLKRQPKLNVSIEGHTDNKGSRQHNLGLSERRATAVKFALMKQGISSKRIQAKGFGESRSVASNRKRAGRRKNRRVELIIFNVANTKYGFSFEETVKSGDENVSDGVTKPIQH